MSSTRKPYPSDVSHKEWSFVALYLTLLPDDVMQRQHDLCEAFDSFRYQALTNSSCHRSV
jgi:hypothetical protein